MFFNVSSLFIHTSSDMSDPSPPRATVHVQAFWTRPRSRTSCLRDRVKISIHSPSYSQFRLIGTGWVINHPVLIPHPLLRVSPHHKAILLHSDNIGQLMSSNKQQNVFNKMSSSLSWIIVSMRSHSPRGMAWVCSRLPGFLPHVQIVYTLTLSTSLLIYERLPSWALRQ